MQRVGVYSVVAFCPYAFRKWLGKLRSDFEDDMTPQGLIALQVHGVGNHPEAVGKTITWRNLKIKELP
jgi:hypothetical protein